MKFVRTIKVLNLNNMKIEKIKVLKNGKYEVKLEEGNPFLFSGETILKYELLLKKEIDSKMLDDMKSYDKLMVLYEVLIKKIRKKLRSEKEIVDSLRKEKLNDDEINVVLTKLKKVNLINDDNYLTAYINDKLNLSLDGPLKIKKDLINLGFSSLEIDAKIDIVDIEVWDARVEKIVLKKSKNSKYSHRELKNRLGIYLKNIGYNVDINDYFEDNRESDIKLIEKDYDKLLRKYLRKSLSEKDIKNKLYYDLLKKGYESSLVNEFIAQKN